MEFTGITKQNRQFFTHLAPADLLKKTGTFGYFGIGAAEGERPKLKGCGVILFRIRKDSTQECYATIEWIYVRKDLRRQGIGSALLSEMERGIAEQGPESLCVDLPAEGHSELKQLLKKFGCRSVLLKIPFYELPVKSAYRAQTESGSKHDDPDLRMLAESGLGLIRRSSKKITNDRFVEDIGFYTSQPEDYFEPELSLVHDNKGETDGWILVHKEGNGVFSIASFEGTEDCGIESMKRLFTCCVDSMIYKYGKKCVIHIPIRSAEEFEHLECYVKSSLQRTVERFAKPLETE